MNKKKKVSISREKLEYALRKRKTTLRIVCENLGDIYEAVRKSIRNNEIMPAYLSDIARELDVSEDYLQGNAPHYREFLDSLSKSSWDELDESMDSFLYHVDDDGYLMQVPQSAKDEMQRKQRAEDTKALIREYTEMSGCKINLDDTDLNYINLAFYEVMESYVKVRKKRLKKDRNFVFNPYKRPLWNTYEDIKKEG